MVGEYARNGDARNARFIRNILHTDHYHPTFPKSMAILSDFSAIVKGRKQDKAFLRLEGQEPVAGIDRTGGGSLH